MCNASRLEIIDIHLLLAGGRYSVENCHGIHVLQPFNFYPMSWTEATELFVKRRSEQEWENILDNSYSIDFYRTSSNNTTPITKPKYYGKKIPAYSYLGPKYCPLSFYSEITF